ncbi:MAG: NINE protein [Nannocystaceae bacterium]
MKDKNIAAILAFFFGWMGGHKFYLGQTGAGILYLLFWWTTIPAILGIIEFIILALMDKDEFNRRFNGQYTLAQSPVVVNMLPPAGPQYHGYQAYPPPPTYGQPPYGQPYGYPPQYPGAPGQPYATRPVAHPPQQSTDDVVARLEKLNELRIAGLLTDEEFAKQKARILDSM